MTATPSAQLLARVRASGSSFYWAMRLMPKEAREDMAALYLFCRAIDDCADDAGLTEKDKRTMLDLWRQALDALPQGCPDPALGLALKKAIERRRLPLACFHAVIDGCLMDVPFGLQAPSLETLSLYCSRVAGAVGLLSVRIMGAQGDSADGFALATGEALQCVNILRDVHADAQSGRLYLPRPLLIQAGLDPGIDPEKLARDRRFPSVCEAFGAQTEAKIARAWEEWRRARLSTEERRKLRPALAMLACYQTLFQRLKKRRWNAADQGTGAKISFAVLTLRIHLFGIGRTVP